MEEIYRIFSCRLQFHRLLAVVSRSLLPDCLYDGLVIFTDVIVPSFWVQGQLQFPLGHNPLDPLAVGGVTGRSVAGSAILQETAVLYAAVATVRTSLLHQLSWLSVHSALASN